MNYLEDLSRQVSDLAKDPQPIQKKRPGKDFDLAVTGVREHQRKLSKTINRIYVNEKN
jgi:hypothetical protein